MIEKKKFVGFVVFVIKGNVKKKKKIEIGC